MGPFHRPSAQKTLRRLAMTLGVIAGLSWLAGFVRFVRAHGVATAAATARDPHPRGEHNLLALRHGPEVRASSYHRAFETQHHPIFLVDGRQAPHTIEKWASAPNDKAPWVELRWSERRAVSRVVIRHAGSVEDERLTARRYTIRCIDAAEGRSIDVRDNHAAVATHELGCKAAQGVRLDFVPADDDIVRVYEVEAWGE